MSTMSKAELAQQVMAYAEAHYHENGWDTVVECYSMKKLAAEIKDNETFQQVIDRMERIGKIVAEIKRDRMEAANAEYVAAGEPPFWNI